MQVEILSRGLDTRFRGSEEKLKLDISSETGFKVIGQDKII